MVSVFCSGFVSTLSYTSTNFVFRKINGCSFSADVTSCSQCYKISMKNSKCAVSIKHIQDGQPGRYENCRRTKKNVQTDHPVVPDTRRHPEEAEKRAEPSVVSSHTGKCRKRPSRIKVQPVSRSLQELRNISEDARGTLSS